MEMNSIEALLIEQLRDLYSAEGQLLKALPKMGRKATDPSLRDAFETHLEETRVHVERLQEIGEALGIKLGGHKCKAMEGLVEEGSEVLEMEGDDAVIDAALIAAAQRVEHYEISAYGTARTLAERVGEQQLVGALQQTLDEEYATDEKLTQICEGELLANAPVRAGMIEEGEDDESGNSNRSGFMAESDDSDEDESEMSSGSRSSSGRSGSNSYSGGSKSAGNRSGASRSSSSRGSSSRSGSYSGSGGGSSGGSSRSGGSSNNGRSGSRSGSSNGSSGSRGGSSSRSGSSGGSSRSGSSNGGSRSGSSGGSSRSGSSGGSSRSSGGSSRSGSSGSRSGSSSGASRSSSGSRGSSGSSRSSSGSSR